MTVTVAAVDLGASSGRVMVGRVGESTLRLEAVARFANDPVRDAGRPALGHPGAVRPSR